MSYGSRIRILCVSCFFVFPVFVFQKFLFLQLRDNGSTSFGFAPFGTSGQAGQVAHHRLLTNR
jgi:hypothetical protein